MFAPLSLRKMSAIRRSSSFLNGMTHFKKCTTILNCLILAAIVAPVAMYGQTDTATILGAVVDASGATVAGAVVTVTAIGTSTRTVVKTNSLGAYVVTPLRIGNYSVSVEDQGFKTETRNNIVLQVQDRLRVDFALQVGSVHEQVVVDSAPPMLQLDSSELGQVIDSQQIQDLPLNGRDYTQLVSLTSGVIKIKEGSSLTGTSTASNGNAGGSFAVNGTRGMLNNFVLDGIDNNSNDNGGNVLKTNVDAIAEFRVETSNYSAEFGRSGGAVINATIKSGSNSLHGSAFEFARNSALDTRQYFEQPGTAKAPYSQHQFGGTIGGPILRNKLFYFVDYQGSRVSTSSIDFSSVPTPAEVGGDFSDLGSTIYDPATTVLGPDGSVISRQPFPGNIVPTTRLDPVAHNMARLFPAPNVPGAQGGNNYVQVDPSKNQIDQGDVRVDNSISQNQLLFVRYSQSHGNASQATPLPGLADGSTGGQGLDMDQTHGLAVGHTYTFSPTVVNDARVGFSRETYQNGVPAYGLKYPSADLLVPGVPNDPRVNGLTLYQITGYTRIGMPGFQPTDSVSMEIQYGDTLSLVRGRHSIKTGVQFHRSFYSILQQADPRGRFRMTGAFTADSPSSGDGTGSSLADELLGLPVQGDISNAIKLNNRQNTYGAFVQDDFKVSPRLALNVGLRYDYVTPIYETSNKQSNFDYATEKLIPAGVNGATRGLVKVDHLNFAPRVGFSWSAFKDTAVRAGYGRFFSAQEVRTSDPFQLAYNAPFVDQSNFLTDGSVTNLTVSGGFPPLEFDLDKITGEAITVSASGYNTRLHSAALDEWNLNIQQEFPGKVLLEIAYVGSKSTHLQSVLDRNQDKVPGPGDIQARRPMPQYSGFNAMENIGNSSYNGLDVKVEKRLSYGLNFLSAFTWSRSANDFPEICCSSPTPQNTWDTSNERGRSDFDQKLRSVTSFDYLIPVGRGHMLLGANKAQDLVFGGWHFGGILTLHTGFYMSPWIGYDPSNTGSGGALRSDQVCDGNLASGKRNINNWFNVNCFPLPQPYTFGNAEKNSLIGPGEVSADLALRKVFNIAEHGHLEIRAETFNAFNHPSFALPDNYIDDGPGETAVITSTVLAQREIQFGAKFNF
jgi:outer membrane receptor protein involved in Fe transport